MMLTKLYVQTATAHGRKNKNQDCILYGTKILQENAAVDLEARGMLVDFETFTTGEEGLLFAVADGISGGEAGERASRESCRLMRRYASDWKSTISMEQVNKGILEFYRENLPGAMRGSGSTLSCVYIRNDSAEAVNVGDSPIYLFRNGTIRPLYRQHTRAAWKKNNGYAQKDISEQDRHALIAYVGCRMNISEVVNREKFILQDGDIILIASDGLTEGISLERLMEVTGDIRYKNAAAQAVREALENSTDNVTGMFLYVKNTEDWNQDRKIKAFQDMKVEQIAWELMVSRDTAGKIHRGAYVPDTREKVLKIGLLAEFSECELDYWLEKMGYPVLYSRNITDFIVKFIIHGGYSGSGSVFLYQKLQEALGQKLYLERHNRVPIGEMNTFGVDDVLDNMIGTGNDDKESTEDIIYRFEKKIESNPSLREGFENRYAFARAYLNYMINQIYCCDGFIPYLQTLGIPLENAKAISNRKSAMYRGQIKNGEAVVSQPSRDFFIALALFLKLDLDELNFLLEQNGLRTLEPEDQLDGIILRALIPLEENYPVAFGTDIPAARNKEQGWDVIREAGLDFAFESGAEDHIFLYPRELVRYLLKYIRTKEPLQMVFFRQTRLYRHYLYLLDR